MAGKRRTNASAGAARHEYANDPAAGDVGEHTYANHGAVAAGLNEGGGAQPHDYRDSQVDSNYIEVNGRCSARATPSACPCASARLLQTPRAGARRTG